MFVATSKVKGGGAGTSVPSRNMSSTMTLFYAVQQEDDVHVAHLSSMGSPTGFAFESGEHVAKQGHWEGKHTNKGYDRVPSIRGSNLASF